MTEPRVYLIAAIDRNNLIGRENRMPWNIREDLRRFRAITLGHTIVMGKNTWLSLGRT
ncbi:MAG TPA: dihydrofolate reductase, partial [Candidatus Syntrophosphaera sp.]|nr:dihydrofolate reductase [Candidatus Syntrophosphaera sp.]